MHLRLVPTIGLVAVSSTLADLDGNFPGMPPREDFPYHIPSFRTATMTVRDDLWNLVDSAYPNKGSEKHSGAHYRKRRRLFIVLKEAGEKAPTTVMGARSLLSRRQLELRREVKLMVDRDHPVKPGDKTFNLFRKTQVDNELERAFSALAQQLGIQSA